MFDLEASRCLRCRLVTAAVLTLLAVPLAALPQAADPESHQTDEATAEASGREPGAAEAAQPAATERATILVEASLPYVPKSNTIATKLPVELEWTPANVGVVSSPLLEEQNARVLTDALENVSGLNVQTGSGAFDFFLVRSFDSLTSGLVLTDGAPEPEATFYQLYNTERVEVLKGPGGFLYGSNPLAGAVNIVRKQPTPSNFAVLGATFGSYDTFEGTVDLNRASASGELSFRLNGLWRDSDGYRDGRQTEVAAVNPALTWRPNDRTTLNLNFEFVDSDYTPDAGIPIVGGEVAPVPRDRSYASPLDRSEQEIHRFQIDFERRLSEHLTLRNKTYYRELDWLADGTLFGGVLPPFFEGGDPLLIRSQLQLDDRQRLLGNQLEAVFAASTGSLRHRVLAGLELTRLEDDFTLDFELLPLIGLFNPLEVPTGLEVRFRLQSGDSRSEVVAPYVIDQIEVSDRLQVLIGARFDSIEFDDDVTGTSRSDGELSPMLGAVYRPAAGLALYVNVAESFAPASTRVIGERKPEESRQVELGLRKKLLQGRLHATLALFELERENIAIPDDNGFTQQAGDQRARGVELEATAELSSGLRAFLAYAYTDSELTRFAEGFLVGDTFVFFDRSGNRPAFSPEHLANAWLSKRLNRHWTVAGGLRYVDEQFIAEDNVTELDDYLLLDAAATLRFGNWRWRLHLENLTDEEYDTRGFGALSVIPGRPITATLGVDYRF
ncbi:MAG: TonB-dependent receptor [Thermoanaerobaculia bacterium]